MLAAAPTAAPAQPLVCDAIRYGESATQAARRITGDARNTYQTWFHIVNPSSRSVPKSQYDRVRAGWRACVPTSAIARRASSNAGHLASPEAIRTIAASARPVAVDAPPRVNPAGSLVRAGERRQSSASSIVRAIGAVDLTVMWLGAAMVVPLFGWRILDDHLARQRTRSIVMRHFAERFIDEFERPLARYQGAERPLRARLRCRPRRGRFDILLAPSRGRRYPNLSDHKKNVEYDVARVLKVLGDESVVSGPLSMHAGWVVVPFHLTGGPKQTGVTCISSL